MDSMSFTFFSDLFVVFFAVAIGITYYKTIKQKLGFIFLYVCLSAGTQLLVNLSQVVGFKNNMPGLHLYLIVEFSLISLFYLRQFDEFINRKWFFLFFILFITYSIINSIFIQGFWTYPNIPRAIEALILMVFSILYFYKILVETKITVLMKDATIWINLAILIYFSGNLFFFILFNVALDYSREFAKLISFYFSILNAFYYILIAIGFYISKNEQGNKPGKRQNIIA